LIDVQVEEIGPCKKRLKVRVPLDDIKLKLEESYTKLRESAHVSGFRKGHAPRKLLEKRFGGQILEELKQSVMAEASGDALKKAELKVLGEPSFDSAEFKIDQDFTFDITIEVEPEVNVANYQGLELKKLPDEVTPEDVDQGVKSLLANLAKLEPAVDGEVRAGDVITADWEVKVGDDVALSGKQEKFEVHENLFAGLNAGDVMGKVLGAKSGDVRETDVSLPADFPLEKFRAKDGKLTITVAKVERRNVPELTEDSVKTMGFDSVEDVRQAVRRRITERKKEISRENLERQVSEKLLDMARFDLPQGVLKRQSQRNLDRQQMRLRMRGLPDDEIVKRLDDLRAASEQAAERDFKMFFILSKIAEAEKIFVTENEVEATVARLANAYQKSVHKFQQELEQQGLMDDLRAQMRYDKALSYVIENAKIAGQS
jgi:trigger factor